MRRAFAVLGLVAVSCSRSDAPAPPAAGAAPSVTASTGPPAPPRLTVQGVCNKLRSTGAVDLCSLDDAGGTASFRKGKAHGVVNVLASHAAYARVMNNVDFSGRVLASSPEQFVIVYWTSTGSDSEDGLIRTVVETL